MDIVKILKEKCKSLPDINFRNLCIENNNIMIIFDEAVTNSITVSDFVIRSIEKIITNIKNDDNKVQIKSTKKNNIKDLSSIIENQLSMCRIKRIDLNQDDLFYYIFNGFTLVVIDENVLAVETRANLNRSITEPMTESSVRGPKESFNENYITNLGLIRKRIKSETLVLEENIVGRKTKSRVGVIYMSDIAKQDLVESISKKIKNIDIDGILDSNYIREILVSGGNTSVFPTILSTERPDLVSFYLLEGRVCVLVENSPYILVLPAFLADFFKNIDDYYQKNNNITLTRVIRYIAFFITLLVPAIYIALTTFNQEAIPTELLLSFSVQKDGVPAPAFLEALLMILSFEILREGDFRVPNISGSTLSIVGALILGEAAVSAGIVSPIMIIVVAITTISGLIFSDINMVGAVRTWRLIFLLFAGCAGIIGLILAIIIFIFKLVSIEIENRPYTYPFAPIDCIELERDTVTRNSITDMKKRLKILTNNLTKAK